MLLTEVSERLLTANNLKQNDLTYLLDVLSARRIDYGDLYFSSGYYESWSLEDKIIKNASFHRDQGVGVRAISGEKTGFAYTDQILLAKLEQSAIAAQSIVDEKSALVVTPFKSGQSIPIYTSINPINSIAQEAKIELLHRIDNLARSLDKRVIDVTATLSGSYEDSGCRNRWDIRCRYSTACAFVGIRAG